MEGKFRSMYGTEITRYVSDIMSEASKFKIQIFRSVMMDTDLSPNHVRTYMGRVNDFLRFFDEYSQDLTEKIKKVRGRAGVRTIEYGFVKDYIYAKYDYASVLPFADGLVTGLTDGKFKTVEDIEDFRAHTISKAFKDLPVDSAGVLDRVVTPQIGVNFSHITTDIDAKMFDSIRTYKIFDPRSRTELYKAIDKTIEFITIDIRKHKFPKNTDMKLYVSMINNIIEYITYSLAVYACRVYIIQEYVNPFINDYSVRVNTPAYESADTTSATNSSNVQITIMRDADEKLTKDPAIIKDFFNVFEDFVKTIGASSLFGADHNLPTIGRIYVSQEVMGSNKFIQKLQGNALYQFILDGHYKGFSSYDKSLANLEELKQVLKTFTFNNQGMQGTSSPKQEILHVIRGVESGDTVQKQLETIKDLYICALSILSKLNNVIDDIKRYTNNTNEMRQGIAARNLGIECLGMMSDLYRELAFAFLARARDLENQINISRNAQIEKMNSSLSIKIPEADKIINSNNTMMSAVPDTTRLPIELLDMYAQPAFEAMQLYDECLKLDPEFAGDMYFSEAFDINVIFNKLLAWVAGVQRAIETWFGDANVQKATQFVNENKDALMHMVLNGMELDVLDYKVNITVPEGYEKGIKNISQIPDKAFEDQTELDNWIKSLYPNETIYGWFKKDDPKVAAQKYRNLILFQDLNEVDDKPHNEPIKIGDSKIAKSLADWITSVSKLQDTYKAVRDMSKQYKEEVSKLKAKAAAASQKVKNGNNTSTTNSANNENQGSQDGQNSSQGGVNGNNINLAGSTALQVGQQIYYPLVSAFITYIKDIYSYLQQAYKLANAKKTDQASQENQSK